MKYLLIVLIALSLCGCGSLYYLKGGDAYHKDLSKDKNAVLLSDYKEESQ